MNKDIEFALAVLHEEYKNRRNRLVTHNLESKQKDNVLCDLETIQSAIFKIEHSFNLD